MNEKQKKRELDFVLHYYQEGRLDGRKAFRAWSRRVGIGRTVLFRRVVRYAVAACLLLALGASVFVYQWWQENRSVELVADAVCRCAVCPTVRWLPFRPTPSYLIIREILRPEKERLF